MSVSFPLESGGSGRHNEIKYDQVDGWRTKKSKRETKESRSAKQVFINESKTGQKQQM